MPDDPTPDPSKGDEGKSFTQADVDRIVADRLRRVENKYADYDELKAKAGRLDELEAANKSETERLTERLTAAEQRAAEAELRTARIEIATEKRLSQAQVARLNGKTKEELAADADAAIADGTFTPAAGGEGEGNEGNEGNEQGNELGGPVTRPTEKLKGGTDPTEPASPDMRQVVESIPRGF